MWNKMLCGGLFVALAACGGGGGGGGGGTSSSPPPPPPPAPPAPTNAAPIAVAGNDVSQHLAPDMIALDGSGSSDADGDTLTYAWAVTSQPSGANVTITGANAVNASFTTLVPGNYVFKLTVTDGAGASSSDSVTFKFSNDSPTLTVSAFITEPMSGEDVVFSALDSSDMNGQMLEFTWKMVEVPSNSVIATTYKGGAPIIRFDVDGRYVLRVEATDGYDTVSKTLDPIIVTEFSRLDLPDGFEDAEFHKGAERVVTLSGRNMSVIEPGMAPEAYSLPLDGNAVSISPLGYQAVIAHDGWVSAFSFADKILKTFSVPANVGDIVVDDSNRAYAFPSDGQWTELQLVNLADGTPTGVSLYPLRENMKARLHPSGTKIYAANNGVSPSDIERYDIGSGDPVRAYDSPYHGDFPFCGDLWMGPGGDTILSRCGVVVRATDNRSTDMTFWLQIGDTYNSIEHAASNAFNNVWYIIDGSGSIKTYGADSGFLIDTIELPLIGSGSPDRWIPKFVFATDHSDLIYILAQDDPFTPQRFTLLKHHAVGPVVPSVPVAVVSPFMTARKGTLVALDASASSDPEDAPLVFNWTLKRAPAGSTAVPSDMTSAIAHITPDLEGVYEFSLKVTAGGRTSATRTVSLNATTPGESEVLRLDGVIADMEYSKSLNAAVYLSDSKPELHILSLNDFQDTVVELPRMGFRVGVSNNGIYAAVSHAGMASLINLQTGEVTDTQPYGEDWGDIVLDNNLRAHIIPRRDQWTTFVSIDFDADVALGVLGVRAGSQLRLHPNGLWMYGADTDSSPSDFEKWDASTFPTTYVGQLPYHGDYAISGNIWISETGDKLLVAGGNAFHSSADPAVDMLYAGRLDDDQTVGWADHSSETDEWAVIRQPSGSPAHDGDIRFFDGTFLNLIHTLPLEAVPAATGNLVAHAERIFYSDDGGQIVALLRADNQPDTYALQITDLVP